MEKQPDKTAKKQSYPKQEGATSPLAKSKQPPAPFKKILSAEGWRRQAVQRRQAEIAAAATSGRSRPKPANKASS